MQRWSGWSTDDRRDYTEVEMRERGMEGTEGGERIREKEVERKGPELGKEEGCRGQNGPTLGVMS